MGKGARLKKNRQQSGVESRLAVTREQYGVAQDMRAAYVMEGLTTTDSEIALWLARTVWRNQTNMNCLEACYTLSLALEYMGIPNRRVAVGVFIGDPERELTVTCGQVVVDWVNKAAGEEVAPPFTPLAQEAGWDRGGHMVVVCDDLDLLLDPTFDQFGVKGAHRMITSLSGGANGTEGAFWSGSIARPWVEGDTDLAYFEVEDKPASADDEEFAAFVKISARDVVVVGITTGFDEAVYDVTSGPTYMTPQSLGRLNDVPLNQVSAAVDDFYARRDARLVLIGHWQGAPRVWAVG